jgi:DNA repair exonuclease SbcCD ATPase subunit
MNNSNLTFSNCLIEAIKLQKQYPYGDIMWDKNSPSGRISFYFEYNGLRYRFRRKLRRNSNKSRILFWGYRHIEQISE